MKSKSFLLLGMGIVLSAFGNVQAQADFPKEQKPWSVRMAESEMVRNPESWMLDFQPALKWDYCHGLELGAMLDVYDRYGDTKFFDYALAYADTMVNADGTIKKYKVEEYSLDRINSGKASMSRPKRKNTRRRWICSVLNSTGNPATMTEDFGIKKCIRTRCGWTAFIWECLI